MKCNFVINVIFWELLLYFFCCVANAVICCTQLLFSCSALLMEFFGSFDLKSFWFSDQAISGRGNQIVSWISESYFSQQDSLL